MSAAIGFIALFGQAVLNGVVMVSLFQPAARRSGVPLDEAVREGSLDAAAHGADDGAAGDAGLLPMALSHGIGSETQKPLAVVVIGGLISATLLTLFVLPVLYSLFSKKQP